MTLTTSWKSAKGVTHTVTTNKQDGETDQEFMARHAAAVAALQEIYPPA